MLQRLPPAVLGGGGGVGLLPSGAGTNATSNNKSGMSPGLERCKLGSKSPASTSSAVAAETTSSCNGIDGRPSVPGGPMTTATQVLPGPSSVKRLPADASGKRVCLTPAGTTDEPYLFFLVSQIIYLNKNKKERKKNFLSHHEIQVLHCKWAQVISKISNQMLTTKSWVFLSSLTSTGKS